MKHQLNILEDTLMFWEDWNKTVEFNYLNNKINEELKYPLENSVYKKPLPGTEVNSVPLLARSIASYKNLRTLLESKDTRPLQEVSVESEFLPTIPKDKEETYNNKLSFVLSGLSAAHQIPIYLSEWAIEKKVCIVTKPGLIPIISPELGTNYLDKLPYDSFLIELKDPFTYTYLLDVSESITLNYYHIMVQVMDKVDGVTSVGIFMIPEAIKDYCYSEEDMIAVDRMILDLKEIERLLRRKSDSAKFFNRMKKLLKDIDKREENLEIKTGDSFVTSQLLFYSNLVEVAKGETLPQMGLNAVNMSEDKNISADFALQCAGFLNGFCKVISEANQNVIDSVSLMTTDDVLELVTDGSESIITTMSTSEQESLLWYEVPEQAVDFLKLRRYKGATQVTFVQGTEKRPHARRKHPRVYKNKDGSIKKTVWVRQSFIHKERLRAGEQSKSGILKV